MIASELATRARQKAEDASARQRDIEKLYKFSQELLRVRERYSTSESDSRADRGHI